MKARITMAVFIAAALLAIGSFGANPAAAARGNSDSLRSLALLTNSADALNFVGRLDNILHTALVAAPQDDPIVSAVTPNQAYDFQTTTITISGSGFSGVPTVTLGLNQLGDVTLVDSNTLTATVPAGLGSQPYDLTVTNPDGGSSTLADAFTVLRPIDGQVSQWRGETRTRSPHGGGSALAVGNFIYLFSGTAVERATVNSDGTLTSWEQLANLPKQHYGSALIIGGYVYLFGGDTSGLIQRLPINADDSLGSPELVTPPSGSNNVYNYIAVQANDYVYLSTRSGSFPYQTFVDRAHINAGGALDAWEPISGFPDGESMLNAFVVGNYIFALNQNETHNVLRAEINADGTLGAWQVIGTTPDIEYYTASEANGYIYILGGGQKEETFCCRETATVRVAQVYDDGSLGPWRNTNRLAQGQQGGASVVFNQRLYVIGGYYVYLVGGPIAGTQVLDDVHSTALVPIAIVPGAVQPAQNSTVTLVGSNFEPATEVSINGESLAVSYVSSTTLRLNIPAGWAEGAYTAVITNPGSSPITLTNALNVDGTAPTGTISINSGAAFSSNPNVNLQFAAADELSGLAFLALSADGVSFTSPQPYVADLNWLLDGPDGVKTIYVRFTDKAGNVSAIVSDSILLDTTGPVGSMQINDGAEYTHSPSVNLNISATDAGTGVYQVSFRDDFAGWSEWRDYSGPTIVHRLPFAQGTRTVEARFSDIAGNISNVVSDTIILDTVAATATINPMSAYQTGFSFTVSWTGLDATSGVAKYNVQYSDNGGSWVNWQTNTTATSAQFTGVEGHRYTFRADATDNSGLRGPYSAANVGTTIDTIAPIINQFSINNGALTSSSTDAEVDISTADNKSGIDVASFSDDGVTWSQWYPWQAGTVHSTARTLSAGDGTKTQYARVRDRAGNVSVVASDTIELDTTVPAYNSVSIEDGAIFTNQTTVTLSIGARPRIAAIKVSNDGGFVGANWEPYTAHKQWTITQYGSSIVPRNVYLRYRDEAGNEFSTEQDDIILDLDAPTGSVSIAAAAGPNVTLQLAANDNVSGVGEMLISNQSNFANPTRQAFVSSKSWTLASNNTVYVRYIDNAGNVSSTYSASSGVTPTNTPTPLPTPTSGPGCIFSDVCPGNYWLEPVRHLISLGAISGYSDNTFRPFNNTTRGQLAKIIVAAEGFTISTPSVPTFNDVRSDNPFYGYIETAATRGLISGYDVPGGKEFRPGNNVTRAQLSKIIVIAEGWTTNTAGGPHFQDVPTSSPFYGVIETAYNRGIISGYDVSGGREFRPSNNATRGQIAKIVDAAVIQ